jgi:hypothetical protein
MIFLDNKYTKWYYKIIENRKINAYDGYTERHHIIPRCMDGNDNLENLVDLSAREHFVCHLLLRKMTTGNNKRKMTIALGAMMMQYQHERYVCNSYMYERYRCIFSSEQSELMKDNWNNSSFKEKRVAKYRELWNDASYRKKRIDRMKELWNDPQLKKKRTDGLKNSLADPVKTEKLHNRLRKQNRQLWNDLNYRKLRSVKQKEWANNTRVCEVCMNEVKNGIYSMKHGKHCNLKNTTSLENYFT